MRTHNFQFSVAYADTDAEGIVYHGRYVEFAERARMQMLRGIELPKSDIGFVIRELNIKYLSPLKLGDDFVVQSRITKMGAVSMEVEQKVVHNDDICAIINVSVAYLGKNMRPVRIPDAIIAKIQA